MKFVIDAQLSPALAEWISGHGHEALHVYGLGQVDASDASIWETALELGATIATKDRDFAEWATDREPAPQIVWIRIGNAANVSLTARIEAVWERVVADILSGTKVVEVGRE